MSQENRIIFGVVHKKPISIEQMKKLLLGSAESKNPAQLQRTTRVLSRSLFGRQGRENQRQLAPPILSLRKTPQGGR